jgi:6-phosphogluconolactonase
METTARQVPNVEIARDTEHLASEAVRIFTSAARDAIGSRGCFYVAISGGHTPRRFFEMLAASPEARALPWEKVHVFWVDERYVPADSPDSNYRLAVDTFLRQVAIPPDNVHRIPTEHEDIHTAADFYEETIRMVFGLGDREMPEFDLVILGMGVDGHTGSLFPNSYATFDVDDLACVVYVLDGTLNRVTLTHPVLLAARQLVVLVSGEEKAQTLKEVLTSEPDEVKYPIHILWPALEKITWLVDQEAAKEIA